MCSSHQPSEGVDSGVTLDSAILVEVDQVSIPAMSTIGYGIGTDVDSGNRVQFAGDHRPMRDLGQAIADGVLPVVELEGWQIIGVGR